MQFLTLLRRLTPPPPVVLDPIEEFIRPRKRKLLETYETELNLNANINPMVYGLEIERLWKTRILYESTPRGNIVMYYDIYRHGFAYYADQNSIPHSVLNAVAMKYVVTFFCRDFFTDEETISLERLPKSFEEEEEKNKEEDKKKKREREREKEKEKEKSSVQFAKFKQYKSAIPDAKKEVVKNKFIIKGKLYDFQITQKQTRKLNQQPTAYGDMFGRNISYKAFTQMKDKPCIP